MRDRYVVARCDANSTDLKTVLNNCSDNYQLHSVVPYLKSQHESRFMVIFEERKFGSNEG